MHAFCLRRQGKAKYDARTFNPNYITPKEKIIVVLKNSKAPMKDILQAITRRERLESALYLRLKKRKRLFLKKNLKFLIFFFQKMSHSAENVKGGTFWALLTYILLQNMKKTRKGDSFETLKNFRKKVAQCRKKIGDPLVSSGFVGYVKKVKNERGDHLH